VFLECECLFFGAEAQISGYPPRAIPGGIWELTGIVINQTLAQILGESSVMPFSADRLSSKYT
jgi:hypothetical protein